MKGQFFILLSALHWAAAVCSTLIENTQQRATELVLLRENQGCVPQSLRKVPYHKGLDGQVTAILELDDDDDDQAENSEEHEIRIVAVDEEAAWVRAAAKCPVAYSEGQWQTNTYESGLQPVHAPDLEVLPLFTSGEASNRRNLVFFSDGCRSTC